MVLTPTAKPLCPQLARTSNRAQHPSSGGSGLRPHHRSLNDGGDHRSVLKTRAHQHERALGRSHCARGLRTATLPQRRKTGLAHRRNINAQVRGLARVQWRYLPLTRTRCKPLTCGFAIPRPSPTPWVSPEPSGKRPWRLRDRLDECDMAELITRLPRRCHRRIQTSSN